MKLIKNNKKAIVFISIFLLIYGFILNKIYKAFQKARQNFKAYQFGSEFQESCHLPHPQGSTQS
jgi:hypothetical protein